MNNFCHLHLHTEYSLLDGCGTAEQYAARAAELGQHYLACTDHGNVDGLIKFQGACKRHNIIPVLGCELYIVPNHLSKPNQEKRFHIIALVQNEAGFQNLLKMLTIANLKGFHRRPRIDPEILKAHRNGLVFSTACIGSFVFMPGGEELLLDLAKTNIVTLEIMPHNHPLQKEANQKKLELSRRTGIPLVATADCHYVHGRQGKTQDVLLAIQRKKKWTDTDRFSMSEWKLHMRSEEHMAMEFALQDVVPEQEWRTAIENTVALAEACNGYTISRVPVELPKAAGYEDIDETELLWSVVNIGFKVRLPLGVGQEYHDRVNEEMALICQQGFQRYFLIVWELVNWCRKKGILVGPGRGSVGGSLVAYLIGITDVDPVRFGLIFARFISPERMDLPDIDMDFEKDRRDEVIGHLTDSYGRYNVANITTFMTMKGRGALRDVSRVFGLDLKEVDRAAKEIIDVLDGDPGSGHTLEDSCRQSQELQSFRTKHPDIFAMAVDLEGQARGHGRHAAGTCISSNDLRDGRHCSLAIREGAMVVNWDKGDAEYMGLMKLDVLGLSTLSVLNYARQLLARNGLHFEFSDIQLDDQNVYHEMAQGHCVGIFQFGTNLLIKLCKEMQVREFNDLVLINALSRPGPLASGVTNQFIRRRSGIEPVIYIHERLRPHTDETLGLVLYQEQVMWVMNQLAGLPWGVCDKVRKIMAKSRGAAEFNVFLDQFINGCKSQGTLERHEAEDVWNTLASFASYAFNKSHSVEYSLIGYWTAWLKFNHPLEFMAALLTHGSEKDKPAYVSEALRLGIAISLPRLGKSMAMEWVPDHQKNSLLAPFTEIKGIGSEMAAKITGRPTQNNHGFFSQCDIPSANGFGKVVDEALAKIGADGRQLSEAELQVAQQYFSFNIIDKAGRFRHVIQLDYSLANASEADMLTCNLRASLIRLKAVQYNLQVDCDKCELRAEAKALVSPSMGRYNIMAVGEAPGVEENEQGVGFVGDSGTKQLWPELAKYGIYPQMLHVTNVCKCYPGKRIKTPGKKHIEACRPILEAEIASIRPVVILAFGNTSVKFFLGKDGGITDMSGKTEWSDRYGCWLCWCLHPASVLHSPANRSGFETGIENFAMVLDRLGGPLLADGRGLDDQCQLGGEWGAGNNNYAECVGCPQWHKCAEYACSMLDWRVRL